LEQTRVKGDLVSPILVRRPCCVFLYTPWAA
jgi:hypothetical protein